MNLDQLPTPVLYELLRFFNIGERMELYNAFVQWDYVIEFLYYNTTSLCIYPNNMGFPFEKRWSFTNKMIGYQNSIEISDFRQMPNIVHLKDVRRLCLVGPESIWVLKEVLMQFTSLEHLETDFISSFHCLNKKELPKLKILALRNFSSNKPCNISAPLLEVLIWYPTVWFQSRTDSLISFINPVELKYLQCNSYPPRCGNVRFDRLQTLICERLDEPISLYELPALKQLQICQSVDSALVRNLETQRFQLGNCLNMNFLNLYHFLSIDQLGYHLTSCYFLRAEQARKMLNELFKSDLTIPHQLCLYYTGFSKQFNDGQTQALLKRLTNVYKVEVFDRTNADHLIAFLRQCGAFKMLDLYYTAFDERFYDQLSQFKSISYLKIKEQLGWHINTYDFLKGFTDLRTIYMHWDGLAFKIEQIFAFLEAAFKHCANLQQFVFGRKYFKCVIRKSTCRDCFCMSGGPFAALGLSRYYSNIDSLLSDLSTVKQKLSVDVLIPIQPQSPTRFLN